VLTDAIIDGEIEGDDGSMPELPEVEITRRAIAPFLEGEKVSVVVARTERLRLPLPASLIEELPGQIIHKLERRAKYLLLRTDGGSVLIHLGMSGSLHVVPSATPPAKHDHLDLILETGMLLRLADPRRFGLALWTKEDPLDHPLLKVIGPEPLEEGFNGDYLFQKSRGRRVAVKELVMDGHVVAGLGNIYASEALFRAGIHPAACAGVISRERYRRLVNSIRIVLNEAIAQGEVTLGGCQESKGNPGYFPIRLDIYGRDGEQCNRCGAVIQLIRQGGRSSFFCKRCQR
jgi:formamidopyrimidine-DNA glycosylase